MGSDPAPFFANLFLYHYESSWLKGIKKTNNSVARKFGNVFRYIDDLLALNDGLSFESYYREIYPEELQLTKENITNDETNFLDFNIKINNRVLLPLCMTKEITLASTLLDYLIEVVIFLAECSTQAYLQNAYAYAELHL